MDISREGRLKSVDITRTIAVIMMVFANMAIMLVEPHSIPFRLAGSFAAPLFMMLAGMMVAKTASAHSHGFYYYLARCAAILAIASIIDILFWGILPFTTVDVLYFISISLPLAYLIGKCRTTSVILIAVLIFALTPLLQKLFGYTYYPTEYYLNGSVTVEVVNQTGILNHWFVDGWFPIFPWLGYTVIGVLLARRELFSDRRFFIGAIALVIIGAVLWYNYPGQLYNREGWSEMFYPPTLGYIVTSMGVLGIICSIAEYSAGYGIWDFLIPLGQSSLIVYFFQYLVIGRIYSKIYDDIQMPKYFLLYFILMVFLLAMACLVRFIRLRIVRPPFVLHVFLGG